MPGALDSFALSYPPLRQPPPREPDDPGRVRRPTARLAAVPAALGLSEPPGPLFRPVSVPPAAPGEEEVAERYIQRVLGTSPGPVTAPPLWTPPLAAGRPAGERDSARAGMLWEGLQLLAKGHLEAATAFYKWLAAEEPGRAEGWTGLAAVLLLARQPARSARYLRQARAVEPSFPAGALTAQLGGRQPAVLLSLAEIHLRQGELELAAEVAEGMGRSPHATPRQVRQAADLHRRVRMRQQAEALPELRNGPAPGWLGTLGRLLTTAALMALLYQQSMALFP